MPVVTAFSVSEQITNVGAYAGLASILGLAVLSLLYFGQARELRRLRDWAGRAPERTVELQEQADQAAAAAAQRRPASVAPQVAGTPRASAAAPAAAAGSVRAVPATQAATAAGAAGAAGSVAPPGTPGSVAPPGAPGVPVAGTPGATAADGSAPVTWAPSTAGIPATGAGQETQALPSLPTGAPLPEAVPSVAAPVPIGPAGPPTDDSPVPLRQVNAAAGTGLPRRRATPEPAVPAGRSNGDERRGGRRVGFLAGGAALLLLIIVLATQVLGGGDEPTKNAKTETGNTIVPPSSSTATTTAPTVTPGDFQVFVLNGTTQNGIAAEVAKTLETAGYVSAGTGNAAVNTETTTTVFFAEGKKSGANAVARELGVKTANVKAADAAVTASAKGADVIVQIGADKATP